MSSPAKTLTILSIDGGGIRGVVPLYLLAKLEEELRQRLNNPDFFISTCFDTYSGTSTGAIITAGLSVPNSKIPGQPLYDARFILRAYLSAGQKIFRATTWESWKSLGGFASSKYSPIALEKYFEQFFRNNTMADLLYNNLVVAYDLVDRKPFVFAGGHFEASPFRVREALRASTSAPVYFHPANIKDLSGKEYSLIDGGVVANSPTLILLQYLLAGNHIDHTTELTWLSLGTGVGAPSFEIKDLDGALSWLYPLLDILNAGSANNASLQTDTIVHTLFSNSTYTRINPHLSYASTGMDDISPENLQALQDASQAYIDTHGAIWEKLVEQLLTIARQKNA
ncbi:MAG TPA: patatin-like phospholipase family protein [Cytophagaceae bacterium]|jgi:patatin-like phospholipase/acyl hydrolase|nr:patatin-like phospholipase family protein [Cytophagaceae bacterium]